MCAIGVGVQFQRLPALLDSTVVLPDKVKCPTRVDAGVKGKRVQLLGAPDFKERFVETGQP